MLEEYGGDTPKASSPTPRSTKLSRHYKSSWAKRETENPEGTGRRKSDTTRLFVYVSLQKSFGRTSPLPSLDLFSRYVQVVSPSLSPFPPTYSCRT